VKSSVYVTLAVLFVAVIAAQLKSDYYAQRTDTSRQVVMCYDCLAAGEINIDKWVPAMPIALSEEPCMLPLWLLQDPVKTDNNALIPELSESPDSEVQSADILAHKSWN